MCNMPTNSQHKHVFPLIGNHPDKRVTLHAVTKPARYGNTFTAPLYMINWRDHVQIIHPTHTFISQMYLFTVIQPYPPSTLLHVYTSQVLHTEIPSHALSTCLTDPFMHVILSVPTYHCATLPITHTYRYINPRHTSIHATCSTTHTVPIPFRSLQ